MNSTPTIPAPSRSRQAASASPRRRASARGPRTGSHRHSGCHAQGRLMIDHEQIEGQPELGHREDPEQLRLRARRHGRTVHQAVVAAEQDAGAGQVSDGQVDAQPDAEDRQPQRGPAQPRRRPLRPSRSGRHCAGGSRLARRRRPGTSLRLSRSGPAGVAGGTRCGLCPAARLGALARSLRAARTAVLVRHSVLPIRAGTQRAQRGSRCRNPC